MCAEAIETGRILRTLDGDFGIILRFPPAQTPGVIRSWLNPPAEDAIDFAIRWAITRFSDIDITGKLVIAGEKRIRIRS